MAIPNTFLMRFIFTMRVPTQGQCIFTTVQNSTLLPTARLKQARLCMIEHAGSRPFSIEKHTRSPCIYPRKLGLARMVSALVVLLQSNCLQKQYLLPKQIGSLQQLNNLQSYT